MCHVLSGSEGRLQICFRIGARPWVFCGVRNSADLWWLTRAVRLWIAVDGGASGWFGFVVRS